MSLWYWNADDVFNSSSWVRLLVHHHKVDAATQLWLQSYIPTAALVFRSYGHCLLDFASCIKCLLEVAMLFYVPQELHSTLKTLAIPALLSELMLVKFSSFLWTQQPRVIHLGYNQIQGLSRLRNVFQGYWWTFQNTLIISTTATDKACDAWATQFITLLHASSLTSWITSQSRFDVHGLS